MNTPVKTPGVLLTLEPKPLQPIAAAKRIIPKIDPTKLKKLDFLCILSTPPSEFLLNNLIGSCFTSDYLTKT
jgi:hypothetical protein